MEETVPVRSGFKRPEKIRPLLKRMRASTQGLQPEEREKYSSGTGDRPDKIGPSLPGIQALSRARSDWQALKAMGLAQSQAESNSG